MHHPRPLPTHLLLLLLPVSGGGRATDDTGGDPCAALRTTDGIAGKLSDLDQARYEDTRRHPELTYPWALMVREHEPTNGEDYRSFDDAEMEHRLECLGRFAAELRVGLVAYSWNTHNLNVHATSAQAEELLSLALVRSGDVTCAKACPCDDDATCRESPWCQVLAASRHDATRGCYVAEAFVGCTWAEGCGMDASFATDDEGSCWYFSSTCQPDNGRFTRVSSCATQPRECP